MPSIVPGAEKGVPLSLFSLVGTEQLNGKFSKMEGIADFVVVNYGLNLVQATGHQMTAS